MAKKKRKAKHKQVSAPSPPRRREPIFGVEEGATRRRVGPAQAMGDFAAPLLEIAGDDINAVNNAMNLAMAAWTLALLPPREREEAMKELINTIGKDEEDREMLKGVIRDMIQRHEAMFPSMHPERKGGLRGLLDRLFQRD
jgi:hypothetical protein